jgi:hypothetical protein
MNRLLSIYVRASASLSRLREDRGDVPGWVLVAVMTVGLVAALWLVADDQLTSIFRKAVKSVGK